MDLKGVPLQDGVPNPTLGPPESPGSAKIFGEWGHNSLTQLTIRFVLTQVNESVSESPMEPAPATEMKSGPVSLGSMSAVSLTRGVDVVGKVGRIEEEGANTGTSTAERKVR